MLYELIDRKQVSTTPESSVSLVAAIALYLITTGLIY